MVEQAADCGETSARHFLSQCFANGAYGKVRDPELSRSWALRAQQTGDFVEFGVPIDIEGRGVKLLEPKIPG